MPGARRCAPGGFAGAPTGSEGVVVCDALGLAEDLEPCAPTEYCDSALAACAPKLCSPGELACNAETITQCAPDGSRVDITNTDCAASGQGCWSGACLPRVCHGDGTSTCVDGSSFTCTDNGTRLALEHACGLEDGTYCDSITGKCTSFACEPAQPLCNGELATSCKNDGSGPREAGIDCAASGKTCWDGQCLPIACQAPYQCSSKGELLRCDNHGTALVVEKTCLRNETVCDAEAGTCRLQKCPPSQPACNGNLATTCDSTGLDFDPAAPVTDCSTIQPPAACVDGTCRPIICSPNLTYCDAGALRRCDETGTASILIATCGDAEFCRGTGACLDQAIDTLAANATESFANPTIHFAIVRVFTARRLTQLDIPLAIPGAGAHSITWFVYRSTSVQDPTRGSCSALPPRRRTRRAPRGPQRTSCSI